MISSSTFRNRTTSWWWRCTWVSVTVVCLAGMAQALQPDRAVSDYIRDRWDAQKGYSYGPVYAIAQTADGYLWLGTEKGLVRFDGSTFTLFDQTNSDLSSGAVMDLLTDGEGNLWVRAQSRNLFRYQNGKFYDAVREVDPQNSGITAMCPGSDGSTLFYVRTAGIRSYSNGKFSPVIASSNALIISLAQTADRSLWMGSRDAGLYYSNEGKVSAITKELPDTKVNAVLGIDRELWIATDNGLAHWTGKEILKTPLPPAFDHIRILSLAKDDDANLWIGTTNGLLRMNSQGVTSLEESGSPPTISAIFEDREQNLWIGTNLGLERLRDSPFITYSASKTPSSASGGIVYVDSSGRKWVAPLDGGLYWEKDRQVGYVTNDGLDRDVVYSITGKEDELWIGRQRGGLTHLRYKDGSVTSETYTQANGLAQNTINATYETRDGTVWAGSLKGGVTKLKDGKLTTYTVANGLGSNSITSILEGADGTIWFATSGGLNSFSQGEWKSYGGLAGLPPGRVNCLFEDRSGVILIGTENGTGILRPGHIEIRHNVPRALNEPVLGIAADTEGSVWLATSNHILRANLTKLLDGTISEADVREFGPADGLRSVQALKRDRAVVVDPARRIWFCTYGGISIVNPAQLIDDTIPTIVHIEKVTANGNNFDLQGPIQIQGARNRIIFSYAGLSLSVPERIRFRYKLDAYDQNWSEPVAAREAPYANLGPGSYRFRVMASNSAGVWNGPEASILFEVKPFFWQTWWFRAALLAALVLTIILFYRLRLLQLTRQMNVRFEERLAERTRIAQDLHDTLLQGFLSASMQLHVAARQLPEESPAKPRVARVLELMSQVIEEGRTTLKGLRATDSSSRDLVQSFSKIQTELPGGRDIDYRVTVEGQTVPLHPVIRDEVFHIGREALLNAFHHSQAKTIELELEYGSKQLRVLVRDDGRGIDPQVLRVGRDGHWGISGMRERAEEIGAHLKMWSREHAGTEVELSIPARIAYESDSAPKGRGWLSKLYSRRPSVDGRE